jgi:hypothetical protein
MGDEHWIAVWMPMSNPFLNQDGLKRYESLVREIGTRLADEGLGYFEGAMTGTRNVNLSFTLAAGAYAPRAITVVTEELKRSPHSSNAIAAHCGFVQQGDVWSRFDVAIWPPGFVGELPR